MTILQPKHIIQSSGYDNSEYLVKLSKRAFKSIGVCFMTRKKEILETLSKHHDELRKRFSMTKIGLFGSHVRDEALPGSDIDLLVEFADPTFDNYMDLKFYLEDILQASVDLVMADALKPRIIPYVHSEVVYA